MNTKLKERFEYLETLEDGWFDGEGLALNKEKLESVKNQFLHNYPSTSPIPAIVPTPEGNLLFEWRVETNPTVDLDFSNMKAEFHAFALVNKANIAHTFHLTSEKSWKLLFNYLEVYLRV